MKRAHRRYAAGALAALTVLLAASGCRCPERRTVTIDGSSTVYPIQEAVAEEFLQARREAGLENDVRITIGVSGTGGGFQKFCSGELDITGASRPIRPIEIERCAAAGVEFIEIPVAYDGIAVVVHPGNDFVDRFTVDELRRMWEPEAQATITRWNQIRPTWPDQPLRLYGAGVDSGTYDYFTAAIVGREHASRGDFTSSEDDNVLVQGVAGDRLSVGFFGYAYYEENAARVRAVPIDDEDPATGPGGIMPTPETIGDGTYQPLSRPIFIYVRTEAAARSEVNDLIEFYLSPAGRLLPREVGYISLPDDVYDLALERFRARTPGSIFAGGGSQVGVSLEQLLRGTTPPSEVP